MARRGSKPSATAGTDATAVSPAAAGLAAFRRALAVIILFSVTVNLLALSVPIYLLQITDRVLVSHSVDTLLLLTILALGAVLTLAILDGLRRVILTRVAARFELALGGDVLATSVEAATLGAVESTQGLRDLSLVRAFIASPVLPLLIDIPMAPLYLFVVYLINPQLGLLALVAAIILLLLAVLNQALTAPPATRATAHGLAALSTAQAHVRNAEVVQAMGMMAQCVDAWGRDNAAAISEQMRSAQRGLAVSGLSRFARLALQIGLLGWGAYLAVSSELTAGMITAASLIGARALQPIEGTIEGWRTFMQVREAYRRLAQLLSLGAGQPEPTALPEPKGEVIVEKLVYVAPGQSRPIVNGATFGLREGDAVAVIGPSGAGKSTLARLLVGALQPTAGAVRLDHGDIRNWDAGALGPYLGYVPQDVELFPGTVAYNIARLQEDVAPEQITDAARLAGMHRFISRLPEGYDTVIRLGGAPLSGGQRQHVALARAFFGKPRFVVLDEPDANLDQDGQEALADALVNARRHGITTVTITQRTGLLRAVDKVLVMKHGRVDAYGPRDAILERLQAEQRKRLSPPKRQRLAAPAEPAPESGEPQ